MHAGTIATAVARGLVGLTGPGLALAKEMHQALVTDRAANTAINKDDGYAAMKSARDRAQGMLARLRATPPAATRREGADMIRELTARIDDVRRKYRAYRAIPYERDAHEVGAGGALAFEAQP